MKALVVYDSTFGNTEAIAQAMALALDCDALQCTKISPAEVTGFDLLIVGAPTNGGHATEPMRAFLKKLDKTMMHGRAVATFDTRDPHGWVSIFGYAAKRMSKRLAGLGARPVAEPEGFYVTSTRGPLKEGEKERAAAWAKGLAVPVS